MSELFFVLVLVVLACLIVGALVMRGRGGTADALYQPAKALFSPAERAFLGVLDQAVGDEHRVFGKVRVADVVSVKHGLSNPARQSAFNRISAKHFDFVVCRADDLSLVCVVELNDRSHSSERSQSRDKFLAEVCRNINVPLLMVPARRTYSIQDVRGQFLSAIALPATGRIVA